MFSTAPSVTHNRRAIPAFDPALRHQREHLPLPVAEHGQWVVAPAGGDHFPDERGATTEAPLAMLSTISMKSVTSVIRLFNEYPILCPLASSSTACSIDMRLQHQDGGVGTLFADHPGRVEALGGVGRRHPNVGHNEVRIHGPNHLEQLGPVTGLTDDVQTRALQQARQAFAKQHVDVRRSPPVPESPPALPPDADGSLCICCARVFVQRPVCRPRYLQLAGMPGLALAGGLYGRQR